MALQSSGPISLNDINIELGRSSGTQISLNDSVVRSLLTIGSGQISLYNAYGKSNVIPGSQSFTSSGYFTVPRFNTLTVVVQGGGGAGNIPDFYFGEGTTLNGAASANMDVGTGVIAMASRYGGTSSFGSYISASGGQNGYAASGSYNYGGAGGVGYGGDQNYTGGSGYASPNSYTGTDPGSSEGAGGAVGGYGVYASGGALQYPPSLPPTWLGSPVYYSGNAGNAYGGGGSGGTTWNKIWGHAAGGGGGGGGLARKTWYNNSGLPAGTSVYVTVGAGSPQPYFDLLDGANIMYGAAGAQGVVFMSWS